ncbi:hypothetical protein [Oenococcus kitaharae]|uniref:ABC-2 type transporter domain-containing protein n=1 Tax=Oenococcus kitaharae DSM 17330 TaxID=1045004 RepID=G9WFB8_9LACO|nr:hypothetical protein [Oenococcus kitaharae]EHN58838.1 hypothetical protein OKIT_0729 [Oenococcus kitaharae DSM 17330]OEY81827.1 hypothetical protein NT96_08695 [Oenococcus kitaharae]OEY84058.1 hypothetical protein NT95_02755 [Oenococcus kitaharae]OEY85584.1 hypothetical protein NV75_03680 [Oenococcus kitaharae]
MRKFKALYHVIFLDTLDNKFVFVFNLLMPTAFYLSNNFSLILHPSPNIARQILSSNAIGLFWAYIIFVTMLNMVIFQTLADRESGFYKEYYFIVGSKWQIFVTNFLVQQTILLIEIALFDLIVMVSLRVWNTALFAAGLITTLVFAIPVTLVCCLFLTLKIKIKSISIIETLFITAMFILGTMPASNGWEDLLMTFDPVYYLSKGSSFSLNILTGNVNLTALLQLAIATLAYVLVGAYSLSRFDVKPILRRA